ncbi:MAG: DUF4911 domain-containing protein [Polyangiaceae bacterium]|nr:DUF4911 domain-containing protein [Polyangiaceae bacterium]
MTATEPYPLFARAFRTEPSDMVYLRSLLEANNGLGLLAARKGGEAVIFCTEDFREDLEAFLEDLASEIAIYPWPECDIQRLSDVYR